MKKLIYLSNLRWLLLSLLVVFFDSFTKYWVMSNCVFSEPVHVLSFFNLYYVYNSGIAFSLFSDFCFERNNIFIWVILLIIFILIIMLCRINKNCNIVVKIAYAMIIGGALSNMFDRIRYGAVIDFIDIYINNYHWPTFNLADCSIFFGGCLMLFVRVRM